MAATDYAAVVQQLYISYFGRPADPYGQAAYEAQLDAMGAPTTLDQLNAAAQGDPKSAVAKLINSVSASPEAVALYGTGTSIIEISKFVNAIYNNVLGRDADEGGNFWINAIVAGNLTKANAALAITMGALGNTSAQGLLDAKTVTNKLAVGTDFTNSLDTIVKINSFSGDAAAKTARDLLATVNSGTDLTAAHTAVVSTITKLIPVVTVNTDLTTSVDNLVGTNANDVYNATLNNGTNSTLTAFDSIDGGAGVNTLNIRDFDSTAAHAANFDILNGVSAKNIQVLNIQSLEGVKADSSTIGGVTNFNVTASVGASTIAAATTTAVAVNNSTLANGNLSISGGSSINAVVTGVTTGGGTINIGSATTAGAIVASVTDANTGSTSVAGNVITVAGGTTVSVTQNIAAATSATNLTPGGAAGTANTSTGGAIIVNGGAATSSVTVSQTAAVAAVGGVTAAGAVPNVTESAVVTWKAFTAAAGTQSAGGMVITTDGVATHTAAEVAIVAAGGVVAGLTITTPVAGWTVAAASGATNVFTSTTPNTDVANITVGSSGSAAAVPTTVTTPGSALAAAVSAVTAVGGIAAGAITITDLNSANTDSTKANTITNVSLTNFGSASVNTNALATLSLTGGAGVVTVTDNSATATATTLGLTVNGLTGSAGLVDAKVKTLNIASTGAKSVLNVNGAAVKTVAVTGDKALDLSGSTMAAATAFTSSNTAGVTVSLNAAETGAFTAGNNVVTVASGATNKAVTFGAGNDTVIISSLGTGGSVAGGAGVNTLQMSGVDAQTASGNNTLAGQVTGFTKLAITAPAATSIAADVLGNYNYVVTSGATGGGLTISGLTSGATLELTDAGTAYTAGITGALAATADVLNVVVGNAASTSFGTINAANVETIKVVANDLSATPAGAVAQSLTIAGNDVKAITVSGTAHTVLTAASTALTSFDASGLVVAGAGAANTGITWTAGALAASVATPAVVAVIKGSANGGDVIDASASLKGVSITEIKGTNTIYGAGAVASTLTGGTGADHIYGGSGKDVIVGGGGADVINGGNGADLITLSGSTSTIVQGPITGAGTAQGVGTASGLNTSNNIQTSELTSTFDVIKGAVAGTKIDLSAFAATATGVDLAATNLAGVNAKVEFASGTYDAANGIFNFGAAGADTVVTYDNGTTTGGVHNFESIILVGFHAGSTTAITGGIVTLG